MFGICLEASHQKGLGHLYRALNLTEFLNSVNKEYVVFINNDKTAVSILKEKSVNFEIVKLVDFESDWETELIKKYRLKTWINDRLDTDIRHSQNIVKNGIKLIAFDDAGSGAELADINFAGLPCIFNRDLKGKKVCKGIQYLVLNKKIDFFKRERNNIDNILVTLGGSDTYGVTLKVVNILKELNKKACVITGPSFQHKNELKELINDDFAILDTVPSLIEEFYKYDLAITGGGVTPFEANACGLPCIIVANELFETENGKYLDNLGSSIFAGYHENINTEIFTKELDIEKMSKIGLENIKTDGFENIYMEISIFLK
ncbi:MAG TPA: hypothetical protein P5556_00085 [Candidatus Gastranaerophilales bacterium]|nr:hypothetical protein [Candidatus Gastranaerophilales bacterium]